MRALQVLLQNSDVDRELTVSVTQPAHQDSQVQVAAACGTVYGIEAGTPTTLTVQGAGEQSQECSKLATQNESRWDNTCRRCPHIAPQTAYVLLLTADNGPPGRRLGLSDVTTLHVTTADTAAPEFSVAPLIADISTDRFALQFGLSEAGLVHYAVAYSAMQAPFFSYYLLSFMQLGMSAEQVRNQANLEAAALRPDGIVAAGSVLASANEVVMHVIHPKCSAGMGTCSVAANVNDSMLAPATSYNIYIVAEDLAGNVQGLGSGALQCSPSAVVQPYLALLEAA